MLSRHGSNLARPVIIHNIIHSLMCMQSTPHCGFSGVSPDGNCAYVHWGSFMSNSKSVRRAIWFTWFSERHDIAAWCPSVYGTWQSQADTHPIMNRARRCLTSVIEPTPTRQRRIPYMRLKPDSFNFLGYLYIHAVTSAPALGFSVLLFLLAYLGQERLIHWRRLTSQSE